MMHWIKSAGLAVAALVTLSSCDRGAPAIAYDWPAPSPPFYEISNANGEVEGWMLGTIHALPDGVNWRTPAIDQAAMGLSPGIAPAASRHRRGRKQSAPCEAPAQSRAAGHAVSG